MSVSINVIRRASTVRFCKLSEGQLFMRRNGSNIFQKLSRSLYASPHTHEHEYNALVFQNIGRLLSLAWVSDDEEVRLVKLISADLKVREL